MPCVMFVSVRLFKVEQRKRGNSKKIKHRQIEVVISIAYSLFFVMFFLSTELSVASSHNRWTLASPFWTPTEKK